MTTQVKNTGRVYVWEVPVRLTHWVNVIAIVVLSFTGYYIFNPFVKVSTHEPYGHYFMSHMRFTHFLFAFIFVASTMLRIYWAFVGNQWASWRAVIPFFARGGWGKFKQALQYYTFLRREPPTGLGHNPLAGFAYGIMFFFYFVQIITGFALYAQADVGGFWWKLTGWMFLIVNNQHMRLIHHLVMYLIIVFALFHMYIAFLIDSEEANGVMSSIFSGWKFIVPEPEEESPQEEEPES